MTDSTSQNDQQSRRETIFDDTNTNQNTAVPTVISQIDELIKESQEYDIVVVWSNKDGNIGIISNRDTLKFSQLLAAAVRRIKSQLFAMLEC